MYCALFITGRLVKHGWRVLPHKNPAHIGQYGWQVDWPSWLDIYLVRDYLSANVVGRLLTGQQGKT